MAEIVAQKRCTKCGIVQPVGNFWYNKTRKQFQSACKRCMYQNLKRWRSAHKEKVHEQCKRWAKKHHDHVIQKAYRWADAHKEKHDAAIAKWHNAHPEKWREANRKSSAAHPEWKREDCRNRRAIIKGSTGTFTEKEWQELLLLYGNRCLNPDCPDPSQPVTRDHVIPLTMGGSNTIDNIQPLCRKCNSRKCNKIVDYRKPI